MIKIYNTLTRRKEEFKPINENQVSMYVCGPTVYNYIHIGNARPIIVFDTVRRYLEYKGYKVDFVQNFTDVDDKIINKAKESNESPLKVAERFINHYHEDAKALNVKEAIVHPKVTENIDEIVSFINELIAKDKAYYANGDVYFNTKSFDEYGKLSRQSTDDLVAGARVEVDEKKQNPLDFALWKKAKPEEIHWESPWGQGRPGWHIECSAMVKKYLGETIDIHAGGADLIFPHHENEIAQSESLTGKSFANYWMHNGYININDEKMSKSLGNVFTVSDFLSKEKPHVLRYLILSVHYRNPINFSDELVDHTRNSIERIKNAYTNLEHRMETANLEGEIDHSLNDDLKNLVERFEAEMNDDFNTANAITVIFDLIKKSNIYIEKDNINRKSIEKFVELLTQWLSVLGLDGILESTNNVETEWVEQKINERTLAKSAKNWDEADRIREELNNAGIIIEDTPQGVRWRKK